MSPAILPTERDQSRTTDPQPGDDNYVDTASRDSFPASDPPARTPITRVGDGDEQERSRNVPRRQS